MNLRVLFISAIVMLTLLCVSGGSADDAPASAPATTASKPAPFIIAGYLPDYRFAQWAGEVGPLTDLILFGMPAPKDGRFDATALPRRQLETFKARRDKTHLRILFTVGGWGKSDGFAQLAADPKRRASFIADARDFCIEHQLHGIDYDWEHPQGAAQLASYTLLLKETKAHFAQRQLRVTVALAGWQTLDREGYEAVDLVHLMSYDHRFPQATLDQSKADIARHLEAGCPPGKLVLGVPFYGRNKDGHARTYAQLSLGRSLPADADQFEGYAFNGPATLARKVEVVKEQKLAGIMIWELGQDRTGQGSLLKAIGDAVSK